MQKEYSSWIIRLIGQNLRIGTPLFCRLVMDRHRFDLGIHWGVAPSSVYGMGKPDGLVWWKSDRIGTTGGGWNWA